MSSSPPAASLTNVDDKFLVATHAQAILLNRNTFQSKQKLEHCVAAVLQQRLDDVGDDIKQIAFIPAASVVVAAAAATASTTAAPVQLYAFFNDCTLYIWQDLNQQQSAAANPLHIDMRLTRIKYLRKFKAIPLDLEVVAAGAADVNSCLKTNEATIASVCFSSNRMFVAMTDGGLIVFARNTWKVQMLFTGTVGIKQCIFISHSIAGLLAIRTQHRDVIILDLNQPKNGIVVALPCRQVLTIQATLDGQIAFLLLQSGELVFYDLSFAVQIIAKKLKSLQRLVADDNQRNRERFGSIQSELAQTLPRARLVAILREFHEYPHKYRPLIWKTILRLPQSADEFGALIKRGRHSSTVNYRERYPLADASATRMLQRIVSCLSHWSPVFGQTQWIANFVFPFLKIFEHDAMVCFEVVATVLLNHGQHWFEFHPLPPINYLGMVENVLAHFEPTLVLHYTRIQVTTATYAWPLVQTAFTEMFDELQWMQLWDNILTEPPYFMLFCVVALNVLAKRQLELLNTADAVEQFFDETSSSLDVIAIVCKAKELMVSCPAMLHPKQYFGSCESLMMENDHQYKRFVNYPKQLNSCSSSEVVNGPTMIANETRRLNEKMFELEKLERELTDKRQHRSETVEHQRRMEQVQRMYDESILRERDRVAFQTKHLILCRRQLRARQMHLDLIADDDGDGDGERCVQMHENELDTLLLGLKRDRLHDDNELMMADENIKSMELQMDMAFNVRRQRTEPLREQYSNSMTELEMEKAKFYGELTEIKNHNLPKSPQHTVRRAHTRTPTESSSGNGSTSTTATNKIMSKTKAIKDTLQQIQIEFSRIKAVQNNNSSSNNNNNNANNNKRANSDNNENTDTQFKNNKIQNLELKTHLLENEVRMLLQQQQQPPLKPQKTTK